LLFGAPVVVSINRFIDDNIDELQYIKSYAIQSGASVAVICDPYGNGSKGCIELAEEVIKQCENLNNFHFLYDNDINLGDKIIIVIEKIYGAKDVEFSKDVLKKLTTFEMLGWRRMPVCIAKIPLSLSDDANLKGVPDDFVINIKEVKPVCGAGFIVAVAGNI
jgi:formate--tetrahydrofolate ligase